MSTTTEQGMEDLDQYIDQPFNMDDAEDNDVLEYDAAFLSGLVAEDEQAETSEEDEADEFNFDDPIVKSVDDKPKEEKPTDDEGIDFGDKSAIEEDKETFKEEEALAKLKALGYDISKAETNDPLKLKEREIETLGKTITNINSFINQTDDQLCQQQAVQELSEQYRSEGREAEINNEEFKEELQLKMDEYKYNPRMKTLEADKIRRELKEFVQSKEVEKSKITGEVETKRNEDIRNNRIELQQKLKDYNGKVLFGQRLDVETIKKAYQKITSGEFSKTINSDKSVQAEFALFLETRERSLASGGATYGEGVAAAVNAINGKQEHTTKSSLDKVIKKSSTGNTLKDRYESWGSRTAIPEK